MHQAITVEGQVVAETTSILILFLSLQELLINTLLFVKHHLFTYLHIKSIQMWSKETQY